MHSSDILHILSLITYHRRDMSENDVSWKVAEWVIALYNLLKCFNLFKSYRRPSTYGKTYIRATVYAAWNQTATRANISLLKTWQRVLLFSEYVEVQSCITVSTVEQQLFVFTT